MDEHQHQQGHRKRQMDPQPTVKPPMEPGLQIELPALFAAFLDRFQDRMRVGVQNRAKLPEELG